jgi:hypothetical protein
VGHRPPFFLKQKTMKKFEEIAQTYGTQGLNAPQFPGQQVKGLSVENIRTLIKKQNRIKGYNFSVATGTGSFDLQLSGSARIMLGLCLIPREINTQVAIRGFQHITGVTFKVNNELIIENLDPNFLGNFFNTDEYYYVPRPLSGTDQITIQFTNPGATELVSLAIYYI